MIIKKWCASCGQFRKEGKYLVQNAGTKKMRRMFRCNICWETREKIKLERERHGNA